MTKNMVRAHTSPVSEIHTLAPLKMNCLTGKALIPMQMATNMLANSRTESGMGKVFQFLRPAATSMKAIGKTISKVGKALIHPPMAINTLGPLRIINRPGKVQKIGQMETNMLAPSRMTNKLAKAPLPMPMGIDMSENFLITKNREKAHSLIVMVTPISVRFEMIFSMAKARIATLMAVNTSGLLRLA